MQCMDCPMLDASRMPETWVPRASCCADRDLMRFTADQIREMKLAEMERQARRDINVRVDELMYEKRVAAGKERPRRSRKPKALRHK